MTQLEKGSVNKLIFLIQRATDLTDDTISAVDGSDSRLAEDLLEGLYDNAAVKKWAGVARWVVPSWYWLLETVGNSADPAPHQDTGWYEETGTKYNKSGDCTIRCVHRRANGRSMGIAFQ